MIDPDIALSILLLCIPGAAYFAVRFADTVGNAIEPMSKYF